MANLAKWSIGGSSYATPVSQLTTELNALANNAASAASAAYDNSTNLDVYADLFLHLASLSPGAAPRVDIYILVSIDGGTNYPSATGTVIRNQTDQLWRSIPIDTTAATAQDIVVRGLLLPPGKMKFVLDNQSGVALGATLNTLKISTYNLNLNG